MKSYLWGVFCVGYCLASLALADEQNKNDQSDIQKIVGTWKIEEVVINGVKIELEDVKNFTIVNGEEGAWSLHLAGEVASQGTSTFDEAKSPKEFDFTSINDEGEEMKFVGIYELGENTRRVCYVEAGNPRPKEFVSDGDHQFALVTLKRVQAE